MRCIKKGIREKEWAGSCRRCKAEFVASKSELSISVCPRERYEFSHSDCPECGAKSGSAIIFYPTKGQSMMPGSFTWHHENDTRRINKLNNREDME